MVKVDLRTVVFEVPTQDVISRDNVSVKVSAVVYLRVIDAEKAIIQVENYLNATSQLAQTTLRSVLGKHELDDMLAGREKLNLDIQQALDAQTNSWGIKVSNVEMKQVDLTESMIRAIARQAEAERERRAKVIHAEGELQASEKLYQAAKVLAQEPQAIQLRYLETLTVIGADKNTTIVFPLPMDIIAPLLNALPRRGNPPPPVERAAGSRGETPHRDIRYHSAGHREPLPRRQAEHGVRVTGRRPNDFQFHQVLVDQNSVCPRWPIGETPPMANPIRSFTNRASALPTAPVNASILLSSTRLAPLAITITGASSDSREIRWILRSRRRCNPGRPLPRRTSFQSPAA